jgi:hypothetical protein
MNEASFVLSFQRAHRVVADNRLCIVVEQRPFQFRRSSDSKFLAEFLFLQSEFSPVDALQKTFDSEINADKDSSDGEDESNDDRDGENHVLLSRRVNIFSCFVGFLRQADSFDNGRA